MALVSSAAVTAKPIVRNAVMNNKRFMEFVVFCKTLVQDKLVYGWSVRNGAAGNPATL